MVNFFQYIVFFALLQQLIHCTNGRPSIIQPPVTQIILPGMTANFNCTAYDIAQWQINGSKSQNATWPSGITETHNETLDEVTFQITTVLTLQVEGRPANNATRVECFAYSSSVETSPAAFVIIAGPPLPPHPTMTLLNATTLQLNWNKPFTWTAVADILNYTVRMYNSSGDQWRNWTVGPFVNAIAVVKEGGMEDQCAKLSFDVSATNVVGESRILTVSGGFPIAIKWSEQNGTVRLSSFVRYNRDGTTLVTVRVLPPTMCSYQSAIYDVTISDITAGTQLARTSVVRPYGTGEYIDIPITLTLAIREMKTYYAILGVSSVGSTSLQAIATFNVSPSLIPQNASDINGNGVYQTRMLIGAIVGSSSGVLLLLVPVAIILVLCRLKKAKTLKRECITDHCYQEQPIAQSESFIRSHPPSEPIYEHIRDCQGQSKECILEADDRKNFRSSSTQFVQVAVIDVPPLPLFAERARHTPDDDYVEMKVTAMTEAPGESNCGGFSLPCGHLRETL
eukprot:Em0006g487a